MGEWSGDRDREVGAKSDPPAPPDLIHLHRAMLTCSNDIADSFTIAVDNQEQTANGVSKSHKISKSMVL